MENAWLMLIWPGSLDYDLSKRVERTPSLLIAFTINRPLPN